MARMARPAGLGRIGASSPAAGPGLVGLHAAFTCSDATIEAAAELAASFGVGVHVARL